MKIAILGGGNIGIALAHGLVKSGKYKAGDITVTRRNIAMIEGLKGEGFNITSDNNKAVRSCKTIVLSVLPQQIEFLLREIKNSLTHERLVLSVVSGVSIGEIKKGIGNNIPVVRVMPNTGIAVGASMTCIATDESSQKHIETVKSIFGTVGITMEIKEDHMTAATALCACGVAFFLRAIRAASQGGIEIGFHADEALKMAAQTAKSAASLLLEYSSHPEKEIDKVTSPEGCTIAGLNEMEHNGFSSAMIKGIKTSSEKAARLYKGASKTN